MSFLDRKKAAVLSRLPSPRRGRRCERKLDAFSFRAWNVTLNVEEEKEREEKLSVL